MAPYDYWFLLSLVLLALEIVTGTFYMLVLSVALVVGGTVALLGLGEPLQLTLSGMAAIIGILLLRRWKSARPAGETAGSNLDIGQSVQVVAWHEDGTARVHYRGAEWDAELETAETPRDGALYIQAMHSSRLVLTHRKPHQ